MAHPRKSTALIVVDMQPDFEANNIEGDHGSVLDNCVMLVKNAVRDKLPIIFLEYKNSGKTYKRLRQACKGYSKKVTITKPENNGSQEVIEGCYLLNIRPSHYVVCGVNFSACVLATISGLTQLRPNSRITLVREATNYYYSSYMTLVYEDLEAVEIVSLYGDPFPFKHAELNRLKAAGLPIIGC